MPGWSWARKQPKRPRSQPSVAVDERVGVAEPRQERLERCPRVFRFTFSRRIASFLLLMSQITIPVHAMKPPKLEPVPDLEHDQRVPENSFGS
jgi:hypothetical protein